MQKFILIRGHQGSGKSTFAEQKAAEFKVQYPDAEVSVLKTICSLPMNMVNIVGRAKQWIMKPNEINI